MRLRPQDLAGSALLVLAALVAIESRTFVVGFASDPLGPRAFPLLSALLLALGGAVGILGGRRSVAAAPVEAVPQQGSSPAATRMAAAATSFLLFALLLSPLGFVAATTLEFGVLALLFGGRPVKGLAAGLAFSVIIFLIFVQGLGLPLPLGVFGGAG